jgi:hypothetical protein
VKPGAVAEAGAFTGPTNRTQTAKQQSNTPSLEHAPPSAFASADEEIKPGAVAEAGAFTGRIPRDQTAKQQSNTPTLAHAPASSFASADEQIKPGAVAEAGASTGRIPRHEIAKSQTDTPSLVLAPSSAFASSEFASAPEMAPAPELQGKGGKKGERLKGSAKRATDEEEDASSDEEMKPGAKASGDPSFSDGQRAYSAIEIDNSSLAVANLAGPSDEDEELRGRFEDLQKIVNETVIGIAIVEGSDAGDYDQSASSSTFSKKDRKFLTGAAVAILLVIGIVLGVAIPLTTRSDNNSPSIDLTEGPGPSQSMKKPSPKPTQSPAPTTAVTSAPTSCTTLDCLTEILDLAFS